VRLLLLRHGQIPSNIIGALDTARPGPSLTPLGEKQANAVPAALAARSLHAIYASTLVRTQQTAAPISAARGIPPVILDGLREIEAGDLEMHTDHESQGQYNATAFAWARGDLDLRMPGGETGHEFFERYDRAIEEILESGGATVLAVSHGAAIRTWVASRSRNLDGEFAGSHTLDNTGMASLRSDGYRGWDMTDWHAAPIGGPRFTDATASDPVGEGVESH
jgi:broad specificity phosphatase PhoE